VDENLSLLLFPSSPSKGRFVIITPEGGTASKILVLFENKKCTTPLPH